MINGVILTFSSLIMRSVGFIFNIYVANQVGQEAIGIFGLVMSVYLFAITFASSGIGLACTCIVSEELEKKDFANGLKATKTCMFFSLVLSLLACFLLLLFAPVISKVWLKNSVSNMPIYAIAVGLPFISISSVINGYFTSIGKSYKNAISQCLELLVKIVATIILLQNNIHNGIDAICCSLIFGDVISEFFSFSLNACLFYFEKKRFHYARSYTQKIGKRIFKIAFPVAMTSYIRSGLSSLKQFLIPMRLQLSGLNYSLAISKYGLITGMALPVLTFASFFIQSFSALLVPEYARLLAGKNFHRMKTVCDKIFQVTFVFSVLVASIFLFFANEISLVVYQNLEVAFYLRLLAPLVIFMYVDNIIDNMLKGMQAQMHVMCVNICDLLITIAIIYFFVPTFGVNGYIASMIVSEIFNFTVSFLLLKKKLQLHFDIWHFCLEPCLLVLIAIIFCCLIPLQTEHFSSYVLLKIGCFISLYGILFALVQKKEGFRF